MRLPVLVLLLSLTCSGSALAEPTTTSTACAQYREAATLYRGLVDLRETELADARSDVATEHASAERWRDLAETPAPVVEAVPTWAWVAGAALAALTAVAVAGWITAVTAE